MLLSAFLYDAIMYLGLTLLVLMRSLFVHVTCAPCMCEAGGINRVVCL